MQTMRNELLKKMTMLDFMALDLQLYLNTHPTDCQALEMYNDCVTNSQIVKEKYEAEFGPLTSFRSEGQEDWAWNDCPWPWQAEFNFSFND